MAFEQMKKITVFVVIFLLFNSIYADQLAAGKSTWNVSHSVNGLSIADSSGSFSALLYGFIEADAFNSQHNIAGFNSGANIRRARLNLFGTVLKNWEYALGYELRSKDITNAYIAYRGWKNNYLLAGQFYPNVSLNNWTDSPYINFLETAMPTDVFTPNYSEGIEYGVHTDYWALHASTYTAGTQDSVSGRPPLGAAMRFIYSPIHTDTRAIDLGGSVWVSRPDGSNQMTLNAIPEVKNRDATTVVDTGTISHVDHSIAGGLEAMGLKGPFSLQGEYLREWIKRDSAYHSLQFDGFYVTGGYFLTGESHHYLFPTGRFWNISPIHNSKLGAWEVLAQFSRINLNDADVKGGVENNATAGLNWYLNQFVEFKLAYIYVMARPTKYGNDQNDQILGLRIQTLF